MLVRTIQGCMKVTGSLGLRVDLKVQCWKPFLLDLGETEESRRRIFAIAFPVIWLFGSIPRHKLFLLLFQKRRLHQAPGVQARGADLGP